MRPTYTYSGKAIASLMRRHHVTIRDLKQRTGITLKRIREVRSGGLHDPNAARDWILAITGQDPGDVPRDPLADRSLTFTMPDGTVRRLRI